MAKLKGKKREKALHLRRCGASPRRVSELFNVDEHLLTMAVKREELQCPQDGEKLDFATGETLLNLLNLLERWEPTLIAHEALPFPLVLPRWVARQVETLRAQRAQDGFFAGWTMEEMENLAKRPEK